MERNDVKKDIINRLKTIKGHINGIENMVEEDKSCYDILLQINAIKSSIEKVGLLIIEEHSKDCIKKENITPEELENIIKNIIKFVK